MTVRVRRVELLIAGTVILCTAARGLTSDKGDLEYWAKTSFRIPVKQSWHVIFEERLTFGDNGSQLDDNQVDFGLTYAGFADWLSVGLGYKQVFKRTDEHWLVEKRPLVDIDLKALLLGLNVASRSRFEYRDVEEDETTWRYRNRVTVTPPVAFTPLKIQPFVANEIFVSFDEQDLDQQRLYAGLRIPLQEHVRLELFYLWKLDEQGDNSWHDTNVIGSYVYFLF